MQLNLVALCLLGVALGAPQLQGAGEPLAKITQFDLSPVLGPNFRNLFVTDNNIAEQKAGVGGSQGQSNIAGTYSYQSPEGEIFEVNYIADERGYRASRARVNTPHPLPAHA